jgi:ankyrin repeat protein
MSKKFSYLLLLLPLLLQATVSPENVLADKCLKDYETIYKKQKKHKAFVYAREAKTGKDRCSWNYGSDTPENAKKRALQSCRKYQLNAECKVIDIDGKYLVKKNDFSYIEPVPNLSLSDDEKKRLMKEAEEIIIGKCLPFFKKYLAKKAHKAFAYSLDDNGKYVCGEFSGATLLTAAKRSAIAACQRNRPKNECKIYAENNKIVLSPSDFNVKIIKKSQKMLSSKEYQALLDKAKEIINEGACLYQMKYYLRDSEHKAYYLANDLKKHKQACGRDENAFSPKIAKQNARKKCQAHVKKLKLDATCKLYAVNLDFVGKSEDFGIKKGKEDYREAIYKGNVVKIKKYIAEGMDVNTISSKDGITPIFVAAAKGDKEFFDDLIKRGANIKHRADDGSSLLIAAAFGRNVNIVRFLLKKGLDINLKGYQGNTALHASLMSLDTYTAGVLMRKGADANIKNDKGLTAYDLAKQWKVDLDAMKTLDAKKPDHDGTYPLFYAAKNADVEGIKELVAQKADLNKVDESGYSALQFAHIDVMEMLVNLGADIDHQDKYGDTALMSNVTEEEEVKLLLKLGANKNLKNSYGETAYDKAQGVNFLSPEVKALLKPTK